MSVKTNGGLLAVVGNSAIRHYADAALAAASANERAMACCTPSAYSRDSIPRGRSAQGQKRTLAPFVVFEVRVGLRSRNHAWKYQVSPARTITPGGRSTRSG